MSILETHYTCWMCGEYAGPEDPEFADSMIDGAGILCGTCAKKMDLTGELILSCALCRLPAFHPVPIEMRNGNETPYYDEFCKPCAEAVRKMGFHG